jgi:hypothetical protein
MLGYAALTHNLQSKRKWDSSDPDPIDHRFDESAFDLPLLRVQSLSFLLVILAALACFFAYPMS